VIWILIRPQLGKRNLNYIDFGVVILH
jgi:hypothetical protein